MTRPIAALVLLLGAIAPGPVWAARLIASPAGNGATLGGTAWLLDGRGAISRIDLGTGRAAPWDEAIASGHEPLAATDIALSSNGRTLYALAPAADGRTTLLRALDAASGQETARWEVRGRGRFLVVTSDGARACVVGLKPSGPGRRGSKATGGAAASDEDWTLTVVDLASGKQTPPVSPGLIPVAVALMEAPGSGPKILLAASDRVATYSLEPLRVSWFYKSPGENNDIAVPPASPVVCLLRGSSLAVIDPGRRPKEGGRVQLGEDDATAVIALPDRGRALAVSSDGRLAAVLHDDASALTMVDLSGGHVQSTETLAGPRDLIAAELVAGGEDRLAVLLGSSTEAGGSVAAHRVHAPAPLATAPAAAPVAESAPVKPGPADTGKPAEPARTEEKFELKVIVPEPPRTAPVSVAPEQLQAPPGDPTPPQTMPPQPAPPAPEPEPVLPPRPAAGTFLRGRLTGDFTLAREVLFFGPANIIKLHSRAKVAADGSFSLPLPPAGSYRVVVSAGAGAHIFTRPEFRTLTVADGAGGLEGIDFEVRGAIK